MSAVEYRLGRSEVHCWIFRLGEFVGDELAAVLSSDERERADRFFFERDRTEYVVCRGVLRHLLGRYIGIPASVLRFDYMSRGKPTLAPNQNPLVQFNLAHSRGAGLIGVASGVPIGVDIERKRISEDFRTLVPTYFAAEEQVEFRSLPKEMQPCAFFAGWVRKEAFIKATGEGFSRPLHSFAVTIAPDSCPRLLRCDDDPMASHRCKMADLAWEHDFAAAVAVMDANAVIRTRDLSRQLLGLVP